MSPHRRKLVVAVLGLALGAGAVAVPASSVASPPASGTTAAHTLTWWSCFEDMQCASLPVPRDYRRPAAGMITIALARKRATEPQRRIGALLVNPGGPGASGIDYLAGFGTGSELAKRFDLVSFDPRGIGQSGALSCLSVHGLDRLAGRLRPFPTDRAEQSRMLGEQRAFADACRKNAKGLLPYMTTEATARDMDRIRAALGEKTISYLGLSYGTMLGAAYAHLFPKRVRAFALDAAIDPRLWLDRPLEFTRDQAIGFEHELNAFFAWCTRTRCPFGAGRPEQAYDRLMRDVRAGRLHTKDGQVVPETVAVDAVLTLLTNFPGATLGEALAEAGRGDGTTLADSGLSDPNLVSGYAVVTCADGRFPHDEAAYRKLDTELARTAPRIGRAVLWVPAFSPIPCRTWTHSTNSLHGPLTAAAAPPILVIGSTGDPNTPYREAVALARQLRSAVLLTRDGHGHIAQGRSDCASEATLHYLLTLKTPAAGTICRDDS